LLLARITTSSSVDSEEDGGDDWVGADFFGLEMT
jgi:hypothetical protein